MRKTETLPFDVTVRSGTFSRLSAEAERLGTAPHRLVAALVETFLAEQRHARRRVRDQLKKDPP